MGTAVPARYMEELEQQTANNPTLAQSLQHAIPVMCAASRKRARVEESANSSVSNLEGFLRAQLRASSAMPAFVGDYRAAQEPRRVEAANKAPVPQKEDPASRMLANLKKSLAQRK